MVVSSDEAFKHNGIKLVVEGAVALQLSARSVGIFEAFYSSVKPQPLVYYEINVSNAAKIVRFRVSDERSFHNLSCRCRVMLCHVHSIPTVSLHPMLFCVCFLNATLAS